MNTADRYWHGGAPGLRAGDVILPQPLSVGGHLLDDCPVCEARKHGEQLATDDLDPSMVYVTTERDYARIFAAGYPMGALYRVEPIGVLTPSPDPVPSWGCDSATVLAVYDAVVQLSPGEVRRAVRRYVA